MKLVSQSLDYSFRPTPDFKENLDICAKIARLSRQSNGNDPDINKKLIDTLIKNRHDEPLEMFTFYLDLSKFKNITNPVTKMVIRALVNGMPHTKYFENVNCLVTTMREVVEKLTLSACERPNSEGKFLPRELQCHNSDPVTSNFVDYIFSLLSPLAWDKPRFNCLVWGKQIDPRIQHIITTNRQIATELTRHRSLSKNWESTRWMKYNKELIFCVEDRDRVPLLEEFREIEKTYLHILETEKSTKAAAFLLPSGIKCQAGFAAYKSDWDEIVKKRSTNYCGNPHEYIVELAKLIGYKNEILVKEPPIQVTVGSDILITNEDGVKTGEATVDWKDKYDDLSTKYNDLLKRVKAMEEKNEDDNAEMQDQKRDESDKKVVKTCALCKKYCMSNCPGVRCIFSNHCDFEYNGNNKALDNITHLLQSIENAFKKE